MRKSIVSLISVWVVFFAVCGAAYAENGYTVTSDLQIRAVINTEEKGPVEAVWQKGEAEMTARGDKVIWGHFYASPSDVSWGSEANPDLFVKIWFDAGGRIDVNFFHVSVPEIDVYSTFSYNGIREKQGRISMDSRYVRHEYYGPTPVPRIDGPSECERAGSYLYGLVTDDTGKWTVISGRVHSVTEDYEDLESGGYVIHRVPVYTWGRPSNVPDLDTLKDSDNVFCSQSEAWEEASQRNEWK